MNNEHKWEAKVVDPGNGTSVLVCAVCGQVQTPFTKPCVKRGKR